VGLSAATAGRRHGLRAVSATTPRRRALITSRAAGIAGIAGLFRRDIGRACARIAGRSQVVATPIGAVEFTTGGAGVPVPVVHDPDGNPVLIDQHV
jgi:hypothetical protein